MGGINGDMSGHCLGRLFLWGQNSESQSLIDLMTVWSIEVGKYKRNHSRYREERGRGDQQWRLFSFKDAAWQQEEGMWQQSLDIATIRTQQMPSLYNVTPLPTSWMESGLLEKEEEGEEEGEGEEVKEYNGQFH